MDTPLKPESRYDANFVVTDDIRVFLCQHCRHWSLKIEICHDAKFVLTVTTSSDTSDDKFVIMTTIGFQ